MNKLIHSMKSDPFPPPVAGSKSGNISKAEIMAAIALEEIEGLKRAEAGRRRIAEAMIKDGYPDPYKIKPGEPNPYR